MPTLRAPLFRAQLNRLSCLRKPGKKLFKALSVGVRSINDVIDLRKFMSANGAMTKIGESPVTRCFQTHPGKINVFSH